VIVVLRLASQGLLLACWLGLLAWITGRVVSDRYLWSQFFAWLPSASVVVGAGVCLAVSWLLAWMAFPRGVRPLLRYAGMSEREIASGERARRWRVVALGASVIVGLGWFFGEWKMHRALRNPAGLLKLMAPVPAKGKAIRVATWNASVPKLGDASAKLAPLDADVLLLANLPWQTDVRTFHKMFDAAPSFAGEGRFVVLSRFRVVRWAFVPLNVNGAKTREFFWEGGGMTSIDRGQALLVQLDTSEELGAPITVWYVDLPSDPDIPRDRMMREARAAIDHFQGPFYVRDEAGMDRVEERASGGSHPLLVADVITGDFNTPRGSRSLRTLVGPGQRHAYDLAGWGRDGTYPRRYAWLSIDHTFLAAWLDCEAFAIFNPAMGKHRVTVADVVAR
jgi:hypothetical protein